MRLSTLLLSLVAACGGGGSGGGLSTAAITLEQATPLCMADCQHSIECGSGDNLAFCVQNCTDDFVGWARGDAVDTLLECTAAQECTAVDEACLLDVRPLAIHEEWEVGCRANLASCIDVELLCEVSPSTIDGEIGLVRFIAPELMPDIIACLGTGACREQLDCVSAELEAKGINF